MFPDQANSPDDRLPTFSESVGFDANAAWDRPSPIEQRRVGVLAVRLGVIGQRLNFEHGFTCDERRTIEALGGVILSEFNDAMEPMWGRLFGCVANHVRAVS